MNDAQLSAYKAALQTLPENQRSSIVDLINVHGLHPDDPIIVGPVFTHMLLARTDTVLTRLEAASDPQRMNLGISTLRTFSAISDHAKLLAMYLSLAFLLFGGCIGWAVHHFDAWGEHDRICAAESLWLQSIETQYSSGRLGDLANSFRGHPPYGCDK